MNSKRRKESVSTKQTSNYSRPLKIFGIGRLQFDLILEVSQEDIDKYKIDFSSLKFLQTAYDLINKITFSSSSNTINYLLNTNVCNKDKFWLNFVTFEAPRYREDCSFMKDIISLITEKCFLNIINNTICSCRPLIFLKIIHKTKTYVYDLIEEDNEAQVKEDNSNEEYGYDYNNVIDNNNSNNETHHKNPLLALKNIQYNAFESIIIDLGEFTLYQIDHQLLINDLYSYLYFLKVNFRLNIMLNYRSNPKSVLCYDLLTQLSNLLNLCDILFFDQPEALKLFKGFSFLYNHSHTKEDIEKVDCQSRDAIINHFITNIMQKYTEVHWEMKQCFIIDTFFQYFYYISIPNEGKFTNTKITCDLASAFNTSNMRSSFTFRKELIDSFEEYKSIFYGAMLGKYLSSFPSLFSLPHNKDKELMTLASVYSSENFKHILNLNIDHSKHIEYKQFYHENNDAIRKERINSLLDYQRIKEKEAKFNLETCTKKPKVGIKTYCPLLDKSLSLYYSKSDIRKGLLQNGFIDEKGYIMYDPLYKNSYGGDKPALVKMTKEELFSSIERMTVRGNSQDVFTITKKQRFRTKLKLPNINVIDNNIHLFSRSNSMSSFNTSKNAKKNFRVIN